MKTMIAVAFLLLAGCSHFDYPGGPKDIARQNQLIQARMKVLEEQRFAGEKYEAKRKAERDAMEEQVIKKQWENIAKAREEEKIREEEGRNSLESFAQDVAEGEVARGEGEKTALKLNNQYTNDIEAYIKNQLKGTGIKVRCKFDGNGTEMDIIRCSVIAFKSDSASSHALHDLQRVAHDLSVGLMRKYPVNYAIMAQTLDDVPLANFSYAYHFDILTPVILWR